MPQPDGTVLYELVTGHPDRATHELVFVADLTVELRVWPADTWAKLEVDSQAAASAVIAIWRGGHGKGLQPGGLTGEVALERPAMTYVREQLRQRLAGKLSQASRRWLPHQWTPARRPVPVAADTGRLRQCPAEDTAVQTPAAVPPASRTPSTAAAVRSAAPDTATAGSGRHRPQVGQRR